MRPARQAAPKASAPLARLFAAALLLCVLSSAVPAEAVFNPTGLMACCRGMKGVGGKGGGNSCPLCRRAKAKPRGPVRREHMCGAELSLRKKGRAALASHALLLRVSFDDEVRAGLEHDGGDGISPRQTPRSNSRPASAGAAALGKSCPSDCCGSAAASFAGLRRPRQAAALTDGFRSHAPTVRSQSYAPSGLIKVTSALRRSHPPRAPPSAPDRHTA